jgi:hypothetical protein
MPDLGAQVPPYVLNARRGAQQCLTDLAHNDPCAIISIDGKRYTVAWDAQTRVITYVLTTDLHFLTDKDMPG